MLLIPTKPYWDNQHRCVQTRTSGATSALTLRLTRILKRSRSRSRASRVQTIRVRQSARFGWIRSCWKRGSKLHKRKTNLEVQLILRGSPTWLQEISITGFAQKVDPIWNEPVSTGNAGGLARYEREARKQLQRLEA